MDHILPWSTCIFDTILIEMTVILPMDDKVYLLDLNTIYENDIAGIITDTQFIPGMYQSAITNPLLTHQPPVTHP